MILLDGKKLNREIKNRLKEKVSQLDVKPGLAVVLVGDNSASKIYVSSKVKACQEVGFYSEKVVLARTISEKEIFKVLDRLNNDKKIHGILVQFPLPKNLSYLEEKIINFI